jgi:hypothetical protein
MKSMVLSITLLSSVIMNSESRTGRLVYQIADEQTAANIQDDTQDSAMREQEKREQEAEDAFDVFMENNGDVPNDMIVASQPVSVYEAYFKEIGINIFMKYIAFKIWLEHHWQSLAI